MMVYYDENLVRTLCTVSTGSLPLHFTLNPSEDFSLLTVAFNQYGCNMIYNVWLPIEEEREREEEGAKAGPYPINSVSDEDQEGFKCAPYPVPTLPAQLTDRS